MRRRTLVAAWIIAACGTSEPPPRATAAPDPTAIARDWLQAALRGEDGALAVARIRVGACTGEPRPCLVERLALHADLLAAAPPEVRRAVTRQVGDDVLASVAGATYVAFAGAREARRVELIVAVDRRGQVGAVQLDGSAPFAADGERGDDVTRFVDRWLAEDAAPHLDAALAAQLRRTLADAIVVDDDGRISVGLTTASLLDDRVPTVGLVLTLRRVAGALVVDDVEVLR
jgi:hypothetical protein